MLSPPFQGPASINATLVLNKKTNTYQLQGSFQATLDLGSSAPPVGISILASVASTGPGTGTLLSGTTSSAIQLSDLPCLSIGPLSLGSSVSLSPFHVDSLSLSGSVDVCGVGNASGTFSLNTATHAVDMSAVVAPNLPAPFAGATNIDFVLIKNTAKGSFELQGDFTATLDLPSTSGPVGLSLSAVISRTGGSGSPQTVHLHGGTTSEIAVPDFACFVFGPMSFDSVFSTKPFHLSTLSVSGSVTLCGAGTAAVVFDYDSGSGTTVVTMTIIPDLPPPFQVEMIFVL